LKIAFGILSGAYHQDEVKEGKDFPLNLPAVRLGMLPRVTSDLIDKAYIAYLEKDSELKEFIAQQIEIIVKKQKKTMPNIKYIVLEYKKPESEAHQPDATFELFLELLEKVAKQESADLIYLHLGAGTQIQQLTLYRIVDRQLLSTPSKLIRTYCYDATIHYEIAKLGLYRHSQSKQSNEALEKAYHSFRDTLGGGNDEWESQLHRMAEVAVMTNDPILLLGETGTGKTFLAWQIHKAWLGKRKEEGKYPKDSKEEDKYHKVNCGGLTRELAQSEIFGHEIGAFTGASQSRVGKMKLADQGTLFLDEVADLDRFVQGYLLNAIEEGSFHPLGATKPVQAKFRLICATNRNIQEDVQKGEFRKDLYARIRAWIFELPPLRERQAAIPELIRNFLNVWFQKNKKDGFLRAYPYGVDFMDHALLKFQAFAKQAKWPGNIRDLRDSITRMATRAFLIHQEHQITEEIVQEEISNLEKLWQEHSFLSKKEIYNSLQIIHSHAPNNSFIEAVELMLQDVVLEQYKGNKSQAGKALYYTPRQEIVNYTDKFNQRRRYLENKK